MDYTSLPAEQMEVGGLVFKKRYVGEVSSMIYGSTAVRPLMSLCLDALCRRTAGSSSILLARCRMCEYTAKLFGAMQLMASTSLVEERIIVPPLWTISGSIAARHLVYLLYYCMFI